MRSAVTNKDEILKALEVVIDPELYTFDARPLLARVVEGHSLREIGIRECLCAGLEVVAGHPGGPCVALGRQGCV